MKWNKIIGWTVVVFAISLTIAVLGGYFYIKSSAFRQLAIRKIIEQADEATGGRTQIRALCFDLSTLTAHLYGVVVRGNEPSDASPLFQVDKLTVGLNIRSVLHRKIDLSELLIDHPVVNLLRNREGKSNIPEAPLSQSSGHANIFDLAIGHIALTNGEVNYDDHKTPIEADLRDLKTDITFDASAICYRGSVAYDNGNICYGKYTPLTHSLNAKFSATPSRLSVESATLKVASSTVALHADVTNYSDPIVSGDYDIRLHAQDLAAISSTAKAAGDVVLTGKLHYQAGSNQALLRSITLQGQIRSDSLSAVAASGRIDLRHLQGRYQLANGSLRADELTAELLGGRVDADVTLRNFDTTPTSQVKIALHGLSLQAVQRAVRGSELNGITISSTLEGVANAFWTGSVSNIHARTDLTVRADTRASIRATTSIPVDGTLHATYDGPQNVLTFHQTTLRISSTTLTADGPVSEHSNLQIQVTAGDLHQLVALVSSFRSTATAIPLVSGSGTLNAAVQGSVQQPRISGQLGAQNLRVQGSEWKSVELFLQADPSKIVVSKGTLISAQRGEASFATTIGLRNWFYFPSNPIQANLSLRQMSVADLEHLAGVRYPVSGTLSANVSIKGSQLEPKGSGSIEIVNARAYTAPIQILSLKFHADNGFVVAMLNVATSAGAANANVTYIPKSKGYKIRFDAPSIILQKLRAVQTRNMGVNGTLSVSANGEGTLDDPQLDVALQLPTLEVQQKSIAEVKAEVHVANKQADLTLDSQVAQASIRARAHVNLTGDYETDASIDTSAIPLERLLATYVSGIPQGLQG